MPTPKPLINVGGQVREMPDGEWPDQLVAEAAKTTPVDADTTVINDSADANKAKTLTLLNLFTYVWGKLKGTAKTTPVDADGVIITDSAAAGAAKYVTWANIKTTLTTAFASVFTALGAETAVDITSVSSVLTLDATTRIQNHLLTQNTTLALYNITGCPVGKAMRIDLFVKNDAAGAYTMAFGGGWEFDVATPPVMSSTLNARTHFVITIVNSTAIGITRSIGLAMTDISA